MIHVLRVCAIGMLYLLSPAMARGELILSVETNLVFQRNSGIQEIDILVRSDPEDSLRNALTADFLLRAGSFVENDNGFDDAGATPTGRIGEELFVGRGNIQPTSFFVFDPTAPDFATMSLDFTNNQSFTTTNRLLAQLLINIDGVAPGNYSIIIENIFGNADLEGDGTALGLFSIVDVPEPNILALLVFSPVALLFHRGPARKPLC